MNMLRTITLASLAVLAMLHPAAAQSDRPVQRFAAGELPLILREQVETQLHLRDFSLQRLELPNIDVDTLVVDANLIGVDFALDLARFSMRAPGFQVLTPDAAGVLQPTPVGPPRTYRGVVMGSPETLVSASLVHDGLRAIIWFDEKNVWCIQPAAEAGLPMPGWHVVYQPSDTIPTDHRCGNDDLVPPPEPQEAAPLQPPHGGGPDLGYYKTEIAFDADYTLFGINFFNVNDTVNDIESVAAGVNTIYRRDVDICLEIKQIIVRTSVQSNPYTTNNSAALLNEFIDYWQANHQGIGYDIAHLMTGREIEGGTIGLARVGVVCAAGRYAFSQTRFGGPFNQRVQLTSHEIGHNFRASHCNESEANCGYEPNDCRIMCSTVGACSGITTSFNRASIDCIVAHAASRTCLDTCGCPGSYTVCAAFCSFLSPAQAVAAAECGSTINIFPARYNQQFTINQPMVLKNSAPSSGTVIIGAP